MPAAPPQIEIPQPTVPPGVRLTRDQVMTASEVAELLHMPVSTVYHLARQGELPADVEVDLRRVASRSGRYRQLRQAGEDRCVIALGNL